MSGSLSVLLLSIKLLSLAVSTLSVLYAQFSSFHHQKFYFLFYIYHHLIIQNLPLNIFLKLVIDKTYLIH